MPAFSPHFQEALGLRSIPWWGLRILRFAIHWCGQEGQRNNPLRYGELMLPFLQFLIIIAVIILAAKAGGYLSYRIGMPAVAGEVLAGLILGPTVLGFLHWPVFADGHMAETVTLLAEVGVLFLMFIAGLELHLSDLAKSGRVAAVAGVLSFVVPLAMGYGLAAAFGFDREQAIFFGLLLAPTSVSISAQTLLELRALSSRVGVSLLGAAVIDDMLVVLGLSIFLALFGSAAAASTGIASIAWILVRMVLFLVGAAAVGLWLLPRLARIVARLEISQGLIAFVLVTMLLYAWTAEYVGHMATIIGAFLAGLFFARTPFKERIERGFSMLAYGLFVPIFFVEVGLSANLRELPVERLALLGGMLAVAIVSKFAGVGLGGLAVGLRGREAVQLGTGMVPRGEVVLIVATVGITEGLIGVDVFSSAVVLVVLTTLLAPPVLRILFPRQEEMAAVQAAGTGAREDRSGISS
jgi:Kef-type K+ transport system membrane component KefB